MILEFLFVIRDRDTVHSTNMASSSVSQEDHDVEHDFAMASRRAKVRSARANRTVNTYTTTRGNLT